MSDYSADGGEGSQDGWERSPYTGNWTNTSPQNLIREDTSDIFINVRSSGDECENQEETVQEHVAPSTETETETTKGWYVSQPPVGHMGDFLQSYPWDHVLVTEEEGESSDDEDIILVESKSLIEKDTLFGQHYIEAIVTETQSLSCDKNQEQISNGMNIVNNVTKVPLSKFWHTFTQVFFAGVFIANVIVAILDIVFGPQFLTYKIPTLFVGVIENIILFGMWAYLKSTKKEDDKQSIKQQQYIENIVHELLLYPSIIVSVLGVATEQMYNKPDQPFGWVQVVLLLIDILDLIWTQLVRIYMLRRFVKDLQKALKPKESITWFLHRMYFTVVGNTLLFLFLIFIMGAQMNNDNATSQDYSMTFRSTIMSLALIILPILSIILFLFANSYWVLEFLINTNIAISADANFKEALGEEYGYTIEDTLQFVSARANDSKNQLLTLKEVHPFKRILYGLTEVHVLSLLFIWEVLIALVWILFNGMSTTVALWTIKMLFVVLSVIVNGHVLLLALTMNTMLPIAIVGFISYPFCVSFCFKKFNPEEEQEEEQEEILIK